MTIQRFGRLGYRPGIASFSIAIFVTSMMAGPSAAQYVYPQKGQDQAQQDRDRGECHIWATNQTGFDPTQASSSPPSSGEAKQGGALRGAARGAALGATIGAISGKGAGKGAKTGAAAGGLVGGMRRADQNSQRKQDEKIGQAQQNAMRAEYQRAQTACLEGRGYSVQ
jgi:hypothetical protein